MVFGFCSCGNQTSVCLLEAMQCPFPLLPHAFPPITELWKLIWKILNVPRARTLEEPLRVQRYLRRCCERAVPCGGKIPGLGSCGREALWVVYRFQHVKALLLGNTTDFVPEASREADGNSSSLTVLWFLSPPQLAQNGGAGQLKEALGLCSGSLFPLNTWGKGMTGFGLPWK